MLRKQTLLILGLIGVVTLSNAQNQLYQEFGNSPANVADALLYTVDGTTRADNNYGSNVTLSAQAGTNAGRPQYQRGILKFIDFPGSLPVNAVIDSAYLEFYIDMPTSWHVSVNESYVERVLSSWDEETVTWNNQPSTEKTDQKKTQSFPLGYKGWESVDVTDHIQYFISNPLQYNGWKITLSKEEVYRFLRIRSSDYDNGSKSPRLKVWYHLAEAPMLPVFLSASSEEGLVFNEDRSGVVFNGDFKENPVYIQSEQASNSSGGEIEFSVGNGFHGTVGLDIDNSIHGVTYIAHLDFDGEDYYLTVGGEQVQTGSKESGLKFRFKREGETLDIFYGEEKLHSASVSEGNERLQIVSETDKIGHLSGIISNYEWSEDPFVGLNFENTTPAGGGVISVTGNSNYYYLWNRTKEDILSREELSDLNVARQNYVDEDDNLNLSSFNWTELTCTEYQNQLKNSTSYTTSGAFSTTLLAYNPETGISYTRDIQIPNQLVPAYTGSAIDIDLDTRDWTRTTPGTEYDQDALLVSINSTRENIYSGISFEINDMESEFAIGFLKDGWDYQRESLPSYGILVKDQSYSLITNGNVTEPLPFNAGDRFEIGRDNDQLYFIRNGLELESPAISDDKYSVGGYILKGKVEDPVLTGMLVEPELSVIDVGDYCGLEKVSYFRANANIDLPPILKGDLKLPQTGEFGTNYIWRDHQGNIVSNSSNLITGEPGLYSVEIQTYSPYWVNQQFEENILVGYPVEWKELVGVEAPISHSAKVEVPGNFGGYQTYPVTLDTYGRSSNKVKEVANTDFVSFSVSTASYGASSYSSMPWIPPRDIVSYTDDSGNPLFSIIVYYDVNYFNGENGINRVIIPKGVGVRYHGGIGNVQWHVFTPSQLSGSEIKIVAVHDYDSDETKIYVNEGLAITAAVTPSAVIGGTANQAQDLFLTYSYIHQQNFVFGFGGFDIGTNGLKNIITSRSCPSLPYYEMWTKQNGNTVLSYENTLGIRFYEDYTSIDQELFFKLFKNNGVQHAIPSGVSFSKEFGENRILIRLTDLNIVKGESYLLEAENEKGEKRYLRFTY